MHDGEPVAPPNSGDLAADLRAVLSDIVDYFTDSTNDNLLRAMTAEMQYDDQLATTILDTLLRPQFDSIVARIGAEDLTTASGRPSDPVVVAELLVGPIFHRWLLRRAPLDHAYIDQLVEHVLGHAHRADDGGTSRRRTR